MSNKLAIEYRLTDELIPYARNSRTHSLEQVGQIAASIKEFGFTNPVLIDETDGIIAGHGRVLAAQKLNLDQVPTITLHGLTDTQRRAYVIADNQLALNSGWNLDMLGLELKELEELDFDLSLLGFDNLDDLISEELPEGLCDEDEVGEPGIEPVSKLGDVWLLGDHRLMCADSTSITAVDQLMNGSKAEMIFTDPPYGVDYEGIKNDDRQGLPDLLKSVFANYVAIAKPGAAIYVFHSDRCADIFHKAFRLFFHFSSIIIWVKNSLTLSQTDYQSQHEPCLYGWVDGGAHSWFSDRKQTSIWKFDKERVEGHTTPKPVELVSMAINNSSKPKSIVVDLFGGSGSTLIACEKIGRKARLMELDPIYVDVIVKRWQKFSGKTATLESTNQTFDELNAARV